MVIQFCQSNTWRMWENAPHSSPITPTTFQTLPQLDFILSLHLFFPRLTQNRTTLLIVLCLHPVWPQYNPVTTYSTFRWKGTKGKDRQPWVKVMESISTVQEVMPKQGNVGADGGTVHQCQPSLGWCGNATGCSSLQSPNQGLIVISQHPQLMLWGNLAPCVPLCISHPSTAHFSRNLATGYSYYPSILLSL